MTSLVGLVPAAGMARRLAPLPCSKELFPAGGGEISLDGHTRVHPKPVSLYLLERLALAGAQRIFLILSRDKWDIMRYYGSGDKFGLQISYLVQENQGGMPDALNQAAPWLQNETVLFGMPDTIFYPQDAYIQLLKNHQKFNADITLGLFPTEKPERFGMVAFTPDLDMQYTIDKPIETELKYMWGIGCWGSGFTHFMANYLHEMAGKPNPVSEVVLAQIFQAALESGLKVKVLPFSGGSYIDIGTPEDLVGLMKSGVG
jgi:glucose-1-phosphate thymidylyltransferase